MHSKSPVPNPVCIIVTTPVIFEWLVQIANHNFHITKYINVRLSAVLLDWAYIIEYKILPLNNFFSQPFLIFNRHLQWAFQCHLMMNNNMILVANEMSILQTLKDCNYIGIHKSTQKQPKKNYHCGSIPNSRNKINYSYPAPKYMPPDDY